MISQSRLRHFWTRPGQATSEGPLRAWYRHVSSKSLAWKSWSDLKASFATASIVGTCVVFNIGGNKFRLVTRVIYPAHKVFVLKVLTHTEYDENRWQEECGCFRPPPDRTTRHASP